MDNETKLTAKLVKSWRQMGAEVLNITGGGRLQTNEGKSFVAQSPGWPDCFLCHRIWSGFIEFKGPKTVLQKHQERIIHTLGLTTNVFVVRFLKQAGDMWEFQVSDSNLIPVLQIVMLGTDGQVAASLLKELARLEA